jgi:hypothetical protein
LARRLEPPFKEFSTNFVPGDRPAGDAATTKSARSDLATSIY